jgi:hypothetical protein
LEKNKGKEVKKTKQQINNHLEQLLKQKTEDCKFYAICGNIFLLTSIIFGISLYNMDNKFNEAHKARKILRQHIEFQKQYKYKANLCKELADVSKRSFHISGLYCTDYKVAITKNHQIINAIAYYNLIKTEKK